MRASTYESFRAAARSPRVRAVVLQSFSSGLPLGLVWLLVPAWLKYRGVDIKTIGLFSLVQAPWNFKFLWSPLMDRYAPPWLGRKRSWIVIGQGLLILSTGALALEARDPTVAAVAVLSTLIAFASASQDIAIDAYAVEALEKDEQGLAVGARIAMYRLAMYISGGVAITLGARWGWPWVFVGIALLYVPMIGVVVASPEPDAPPHPPKTLRQAVWEPLVGIFRMHRALEILAFVLLYKLGENLATALTRPFLIEKGFSPNDVGVATTTVGLIATVAGTFAGGMASDAFGLGNALWLSGVLQALGCLGYAAVDLLGGPQTGSLFDSHRLAMYGAIGGEAGFQGLGAGALGVLLLRLTSRDFSATQFAIFSSLFGLGRVIVGPVAGVLVDSLGWTPFFLFTVVASVPGLAMLHRFAPAGTSEPVLMAAGATTDTKPLGRTALAAWGILGLAAGTALALVINAMLTAAKLWRSAASAHTLARFGELTHAQLAQIAHPAKVGDLMALAGPIAFGLVCGGATAALLAVRRGVAPPIH